MISGPIGVLEEQMMALPNSSMDVPRVSSSGYQIRGWDDFQTEVVCAGACSSQRGCSDFCG